MSMYKIEPNNLSLFIKKQERIVGKTPRQIIREVGTSDYYWWRSAGQLPRKIERLNALAKAIGTTTSLLMEIRHQDHLRRIQNNFR